MAEAMGALMNCEVIWRHIHPMDYGTTAVVRFLMDRINHAVLDKKIIKERISSRMFCCVMVSIKQMVVEDLTAIGVEMVLGSFASV